MQSGIQNSDSASNEGRSPVLSANLLTISAPCQDWDAAPRWDCCVVFSASSAVPVQLDGQLLTHLRSRGAALPRAGWAAVRHGHPASIYLWGHLDCAGHGGVPAPPLAAGTRCLRSLGAASRQNQPSLGVQVDSCGFNRLH